MKKIIILILFSGLGGIAYAQIPDIYSISSKATYVDDTIAISGSNFGTDIADVKVFFGAVQGQVISVSNSMMDVKVPAGATYDYISVTILSSGFTAYSPKPFFISYGGNTFDPAAFENQVDFPAFTLLNDLCVCDFDGDNKADIIGASEGATLIRILRNISASPTVDFTSTGRNNGTSVLNSTCGDLDGDGKPDLLLSLTGTTTNRILVLPNTSTLGTVSFGTAIGFTVAGQNARKMAVNDLNSDGKPEIVVTNSANNLISIFENQSTVGAISFNPTPITLAADGSTGLLGLEITDLNRDNFPDIVTSSFQQKDIYIFRNKSFSGQIDFQEPIRLDVPGTLVNIKLGDLNDDGRPDIAATQLLSGSVSVLMNETPVDSSDSIAFSAPEDFSVPEKPWGMDLSDINGDGKLDIIVGSITTSQLGILVNTSISIDPDFSLHLIPVSEKNRNLKVGDVSGDGKPDIIFTGINNDVISVLRNKNCMEAMFFPAADTTICSGQSLLLQAPAGVDVTYTWYKDNVDQGINQPSLMVNTAGAYTLDVSSESGACTSSFGPVNISIVSGTLPDMPAITGAASLCSGETLSLTANSANATSYLWRAPDGEEFTQSLLTIEDMEISQSGMYTVWGINGSCAGPAAEILIEVLKAPIAEVSTNDITQLCNGNTALLEAVAEPGVTYQWKVDGVDIPGATGSTYSANAAGEYAVVVTGNGCTNESTSLSIMVFQPPAASFNAPAEACPGDSITFTNTSVVEADAGPSYVWDFGDGNSSTEAEPQHAYTQDGTFDVSLTITYIDQSCTSTTTKSITVIPTPVLEITPGGPTNFCQGDSLKLAASPGFASYIWSNGESDSVIYAKRSEILTLEATTSDGCKAQASITINTDPQPAIEVTASDTLIVRGDSVQLEAFGADAYRWSPAGSLSDSTISNPMAMPDATTTYVVIGTDSIGCSGIAEITVTVTSGSDVPELNITVPRAFTPNGDLIDEFWILENMGNYPDCAVSVFNRQGITVFEAKPYENDWNATYQGRELPQGVYYYVIRCGESNENIKTGSVTIIR